MYSIQERKEIQDYLIVHAKSDKRIVDAAIVGSESIGKNDKWSDIDLSFGIRDDIELRTVIQDWTEILNTKFEAQVLFDLPYQSSIYRVFLLPNCLQIDLSFTPSSDFGSITNKFKLLFGHKKEKPKKQLPEFETEYGYCILYALKVRTSIERKKYWQAIYFMDLCRNTLLVLACLKYKLNPFDGRGYDALPLFFKVRLQKTLSVEVVEQSLKESLVNMINCITLIDADPMEHKLKQQLALIKDFDS